MLPHGVFGKTRAAAFHEARAADVLVVLVVGPACSAGRGPASRRRSRRRARVAAPAVDADRRASVTSSKRCRLGSGRGAYSERLGMEMARERVAQATERTRRRPFSSLV